uniref:Uncharacterized protein n=1 Tax=Poecilia latipinna TaxID=48699 RepID=A0A3B3UXK8_9TELE
MSYTKFVASLARAKSGNINKIRISPSRCLSTVASPKSQEEKEPQRQLEGCATKNAKDVRLNRIHIDFDNTEEAYKSKNNIELLRSLLVFNLCRIDILVEKNKGVITFYNLHGNFSNLEYFLN